MLRFADSKKCDNAIKEGMHALTDDSIFLIGPHDEGINMRMPAFDCEVWIMLLAFPVEYQIEHYVNKAVSNFGKKIGVAKARSEQSSCVSQVSHQRQCRGPPQPHCH